MANFKYYAPRTVKEASSLLAAFGKEAQVLAGGTDLMPLIKRRIKKTSCIVNIKTIPGLNSIEQDARGNLRIGALATVETIRENAEICKNFLSLHEAASGFGTFQVRSMATIGGNVCRASPAADLVPPLLTFDATGMMFGPRGKRSVGLTGFFRGTGETVLRRGEILTELQIHRLKPGSGTAFLKIGRTAEDLAKVNVAVMVSVAEGTCTDARLALGAVAPTPLRVKKAESILIGKRLDADTIERAAREAAAETKTVSDVRSTAEYRKEVSRVMVCRAIEMAIRRATK